jgi:putative endonuclease
MPMRQEKLFVVYIMTNRKRGVLYVGVTSNLPHRAIQHRDGALEGFTKTYRLKRLVWYQTCDDALEAIAFEKRLKRWRRQWKFELIEAMNPGWNDLLPELLGHDIIGPLSHLQGR